MGNKEGRKAEFEGVREERGGVGERREREELRGKEKGEKRSGIRERTGRKRCFR